MTREEAIKVLNTYDVNFYEYTAEEIVDAIDMAIEALQTPPISQRSMYQAGYRQAQEDRPRGEWIYWRENGIKRCKCSRCLTSYGCLDTPYCPNCGADMGGDTK